MGGRVEATQGVFFKSSSDPAQVQSTQLQKLNRIYCILAVGATLCLVVNLYFILRYPDFLEARRYGIVSQILVILLLAGVIFCGFQIIRQAKISAHKNKELLLEAKQRTTEIAALYDTSQYVSGQHRLSSLLQNIAGRARTLLATSGCALFLFDSELEDFEVAVDFGGGMPVGKHLPLNAGLAGHVAETLEPLIVNDYQSSAFRSRMFQALPISAAVCVPMIRGGELIGVLGVHESRNRKRKFTQSEARLLSLFADNAAGAVFNARLMEALQKSKERFRIAAECASDIVYDWDLAAGGVEYFGAGFKRSWAKTAILPETREDYWATVHPEDRDRVHDALEAHLKNGRPFSVEYRVLDRDGSYVVILDRATAIRNPQGEAVKLIGTVSNITERIQAEQMKTDFVSFVTHQLRTPLSGVKWMLELAIEALDNPADAQSFIQDARMSTDRLIGLVNDLLDISRLERGKLQLNLQETDLADLTRGVIEELNPLILEKEQILDFQVSENRYVLSVDSQLLRQVVINLTSNAMKYTPRGGEIKIHIQKDDDHIHWQIQDNGIGIPKADRRMMFEKFYRAANARSIETEGTGLGLYLVRLIVEKSGGKIGCESEEGIGSAFIFSLPVRVS